MVKIQTWWERRETRTRTGEDRTATGSKPNGAPALRRLLVSAKGRHRRPYSERKRSFEMPETFARGTPGIFCMGNHLRHPPTPLVESTCRLEDDATGRSLLSTLSIARQLVDPRNGGDAINRYGWINRTPCSLSLAATRQPSRPSGSPATDTFNRWGSDASKSGSEGSDPHASSTTSCRPMPSNRIAAPVDVPG